MTLLTVRDLTVEYQTAAGNFRAVENLSFQLTAGESLGIVGESGSGKTTSMMAITRLLPEAGRIISGEVLLEGKDILQMTVNELRDHRWVSFSMIFQGAMSALNPTRTIESQILEVLRIHTHESNVSTQKTEVRNLLDLVGISPELATKYPHEFSGGMRQRAMTAMALACKPKIIIADEPTTALDVISQAQILDLMQNLQDELNISVILVTHDLGAVTRLCDDVMVMYGGWVVEYAHTNNLFANPSHPYTQRLLEAFPDINNPRAELASIPGHPPALDDLPPGCRYEPRCHKAIKKCATEKAELYQSAPGHFARCLRLYE
jgi:oligopeptide/dipeptide ABC transporter ATP-binding protein